MNRLARLNTPRTRAFAAAVARRAAKASPLGDIAPEAIDLLLGNPERERIARLERRVAAIEAKMRGII